ncbi:VF530 family DNA-binding protein [Engelhardtia mirabilis]|uniref:DUF2132 domain-containing protein n=1 Tax=Engelhardtia mirabilis TaxID=2528011 RepID=A0A518BKJ2_9BACT|nr:hypothetical protein Pla133_25690 [Planctomycetes bacterium Pla133]QDV01812.1 hypothetical protein Pla86_25680 [Planctomycetes bacterium Pla86]
MNEEQPKNPLHGITLKAVVEDLVERYGWANLSERIPIRCFELDPSIQSSLKFLRKTPWARKKVERLYVASLRKRQRTARRAALAAEARQAGAAEGQPPTPTEGLE